MWTYKVKIDIPVKPGRHPNSGKTHMANQTSQVNVNTPAKLGTHPSSGYTYLGF